MMTLELARKLGLVETIMVDKNPTTKRRIQLFDFLFVLDLEATCWADRKIPNEIIEFSVVLYSVALNKIIAEFQQYVRPTEMPCLSDFCTNLTGITQQQVDKGLFLANCLMLFTKWVNGQVARYNFSFPGLQNYSVLKRAAFVTWTNWDLNVCLLNECKRKGIAKPRFFNMWIDLKALYKEHYSRTPQGLKGALTEVGLQFDGSQHCGLHDARNTAWLAARMISEGMLLRITKDISPDFE